jgi:hypothetical protein
MPPLCNFVAVHEVGGDDAVGAAAQIARRLGCDETATLTTGWTVGASWLPGRRDSTLHAGTGAIWCEGSHTVSAERARDMVAQPASVPATIGAITSDVTGVVFHPDGSATVARSPGGRVPLYISHSPQRTVIASLLTWAGAVAVDPELDPIAMVPWFAGWSFAPERRSPLKGFTTIERGATHHLRIDGSRGDGRSWSFTPHFERHGRVDTATEAAPLLRDAMLDTLDAELPSDARSLLTLSGGLDSGTLAFLAGRELGRDVVTLSLVPRLGPRRTPELARIARVRELAGVTGHDEVEVAPDDLDGLLEQAPPVVAPARHPTLGRLPALVERWNPRVIFGGEFADDLCGGLVSVPDWARETRAWDLVRGHGAPAGWKGVARWGYWRTDRLRGGLSVPYPTAPTWLRADIRDEYGAWLESVHDQTAPGPRRWFNLLFADDGWLAMNWETASAMGVRRLTPFVTKPILELSQLVNPRDLLGGWYKRLLRLAFAESVPAEILDWRGLGHWGREAFPRGATTTVRAPVHDERVLSWVAPDAEAVPQSALRAAVRSYRALDGVPTG